MTVLLDSCVWIDYIQGESRAKKVEPIISGDETIVVSVINICEIYRHILHIKGIKDADYGINLVLKRSLVLPLNLDTSILAAKLKHEHSMTLGDSLILAATLVNKAKLITFDNGFKNFDNCTVL